MNTKPFKIPSHLKSVQDKHLTRLHGFKMRYCALPDGACLTNCVTAHISCTEEEEDRKTNNKRVNDHIADNFDNYYCNKIILPYIETIGVGEKSRTVRCNTREEFLIFLRSEDSLCVFSNYQEILAIANMLNITVRIFSYGIGGDDTKCEWKEVSPDPVMAASAHFPKGWVPDMYLYHSDQTHYDLLVAENHRLALLGLVGGKGKKEEEKKTNDTDKMDCNDGWKTVETKNKKNVVEEEFLKENDFEDYDDADLEELDEEVIIARAKSTGYKRTDPSASSEAGYNKKELFGCSWKNCKMQLESQGLLTSHINEDKLIHECSVCEEKFIDETGLNEHEISQNRNKCTVCEETFMN